MIVSGTSYSRLSELETYKVNPTYLTKYISGGSISKDGLDYTKSIENAYYIYYIGGIRYVDTIINQNTTTTIYSFTTYGTNSPNFINVPMFKNPNKERIISNPKIDDDVFIIRQEISAFDKNYKLEFIRSLVDLETYAGGNFFNIIKNS
jgi:hypothetical protein